MDPCITRGGSLDAVNIAEVVAAATGMKVIDMAEVLKASGGLEYLTGMCVTELKALGMTKAGAERFRNAMALNAAISKEYSEKMFLKDPRDIVKLMRPILQHKCYEEVHALVMDTKNKLIADVCVSIGGPDRCVVYGQSVLTAVLSRHAKRVILVHNHPSGDATPSEHDISITRHLITAGKYTDIEILDHIIIGRPYPGNLREYVSFRELGLMRAADEYADQTPNFKPVGILPERSQPDPQPIEQHEAAETNKFKIQG